MSERADFLIVGAGVSGLSLACELLRSPLRNASLLIIDHDPRDPADRTLSYWSESETPYDALAVRTWDALAIGSGSRAVRRPLQRYRYRTLRGSDLTTYARDLITAHPRSRLIQARVDCIEDGPRSVRVRADGVWYEARYAFDSRLPRGVLRASTPTEHALTQRFVGWEIETATDSFDPSVATLFDFRVPQDHGLGFVYMLPYGPRHALIECVQIQRRGEPIAVEPALSGYVRDRLGLADFQLRFREHGSIVLTDRRFPRRSGIRTLRLGIAAGRVKPSSGYAFTRILADAAAITRSLVVHGHPFAQTPPPPVYRLLDSVMLGVMEHAPQHLPDVFLALFEHNPADRVLRFLDERASLFELTQLVYSLPWSPFLGELLERAGSRLGVSLRR